MCVLPRMGGARAFASGPFSNFDIVFSRSANDRQAGTQQMKYKKLHHHQIQNVYLKIERVVRRAVNGHAFARRRCSVSIERSGTRRASRTRMQACSQ